jgi:hypothetical protein
MLLAAIGVVVVLRVGMILVAGGAGRRRLGRRMRVRAPRCGRTAHGRVACGHGHGSCVRVGEEYERDGVPVEEIRSALPQMVEILARSAAG